jgi:hypothetical protein
LLFAGSAWSELPISTYKPQELNGEILDEDLNISIEEDFELIIDQELNTELTVK